MSDLNVNLSVVFKKKDNVVIVVMIVAGLFVSRNIYQEQLLKSNAMKEQIVSESERSKIIGRIVSLNEKNKNLKKRSWDTVDANAIIDSIYKVGLESNIKIKNISPSDKQDEREYALIPFSITCESSYKNLILFCKKLEIYPKQIRIKGVEAAPGGSGPGKSVLLRLNIVVEAVYLK